MSDETIDVVREVQGRQVMFRLVPETDRLRVAVSIPNADGTEPLEADEVEVEVRLGGVALAQAAAPRRIETHSRGVTVHLIFELEPPAGVALTRGETLGCTVSFRGERAPFEVVL